MKRKAISKTEKQLYSFFTIEKQMDYSAHLQQTIKSAQSVRHMSRFRQQIPFLVLVIKQLKFIALKIWLLQGMVLSALCALFLYCYDTGVIVHGDYIPSILLGLCGGIIVLSTTPLLLRSSRYQMFELEQSTCFSNRGSILSQLLFIGIGDVDMLAVLALLAKHYRIAAEGIFLFLVIPFLTAAAACLMLWARTSPSFFQKTGITVCIFSSCLICEMAEKSRISFPDMPLYVWGCYAFVCVCILCNEYRRLYCQGIMENML